MQKFILGLRSRTNLIGVHPFLVRVVERALLLSPKDFGVLEGVRSPERQRQLYAQGRTTPGKIVTWTKNSNHFINPKTGFGHAVDLGPVPLVWTDDESFAVVARAMKQASEDLGIPTRWGRDWNMNGRPGEKGETDGPHHELIL